MDNNKFLPALVCGFGAAVLTTVPGIKDFGCCLVVPLAAVMSLYLDHRINKTELPIRGKKALIFGLLTGLFAAVFATFFDVLITYITHSNDFVNSLPQTEGMIQSSPLGPLLQQSLALLKQMAAQIKTNGFSILYTIAMLFSNMFIDSIFGILGGLLGMTFLNKRTQI
jgi:hypothetical protein